MNETEKEIDGDLDLLDVCQRPLLPGAHRA